MQLQECLSTYCTIKKLAEIYPVIFFQGYLKGFGELLLWTEISGRRPNFARSTDISLLVHTDCD